MKLPTNLLKKLAVWIVRHGLDEAQKELARREQSQPIGTAPGDYRRPYSVANRVPTSLED